MKWNYMISNHTKYTLMASFVIFITMMLYVPCVFAQSKTGAIKRKSKVSYKSTRKTNKSKGGRTTENELQKVLRILINNMVYVHGGTFMMGSNDYSIDGSSDERPVHEVTVSDFYIGRYEVTQHEWKTIMGRNPSYFKGENRPVDYISWGDVNDFIKRLRSLTGLNFRFPTEAEWEFAAKGGNRSKGYIYSGSNNPDEVAWFGSNSNEHTHNVGTKKANELGLYDMSGNVHEICLDWYGNYSRQAQVNPLGPDDSSSYSIVIRGGGWAYGANYIRSASRDFEVITGKRGDLGFRLVMVKR